MYVYVKDTVQAGGCVSEEGTKRMHSLDEDVHPGLCVIHFLFATYRGEGKGMVTSLKNLTSRY